MIVVSTMRLVGSNANNVFSSVASSLPQEKQSDMHLNGQQSNCVI
jgi:hypothetical protein